jgi:proteasome alpha subunit
LFFARYESTLLPFTMTEEPYRWLEAVSNRRDYVSEQIKPGTPVLAVCLAEGIVMVGVGTGQSKIFEVHDRVALGGLGHPADIEKIRQAAVDAAHIEAFTRDAEDISLRRLVSFNLGPALKQQFEQLFSAPFLTELLLAELGRRPAEDVLVNLHFDGGFQFQNGGIAVAASDADSAAAAADWLAKEDTETKPIKEAVNDLLQAWWLVTTEAIIDGVPAEPDRDAGWRSASSAKTVEVGWLDRNSPRAATYTQIDFAGMAV